MSIILQLEKLLQEVKDNGGTPKEWKMSIDTFNLIVKELGEPYNEYQAANVLGLPIIINNSLPLEIVYCLTNIE